MSRKLRILLISLIITFIILPIYSEAVKIASWNILNFPGSTGASREDDFRKVIEQLDLDILVVQEMLSPYGVEQFLNNVMNYSSPGTYKAVPFFDGPDTDNALFYKDSVIRLISYDQIFTSLRVISEYVLEIKDGPGKGTIFRIYSVHLKAGTGSDDKKQREEEAKTLRNHLNGLPPNTLFLVCGDFNMRSSEERAFKILTESQADNDGRTKDPINELGYWHDNEEFAEIHTQSTRTTQFGGGAHGGLDDRFDLILVSYGFDVSQELEYKEESYIAYGNDGEHLNKAINEGINNAVSAEIADALHEASDHLPVIIELEPPSYISYTLTISTGTGGTTDPEPGSYTHNSGTKVTITAIPDNNYIFKVWTGDVSSAHEKNNPLTITMDSDKSIKANFIRQYKLTIAAGPGGTTDPPPGSYIHDYGTDVTITAIADTRYKFSNWSGDASGTNNPITITMDTDKSIKANFVQQYEQYTLTIASSKGGTTNPSPGSYTYDEGTEVVIRAMPNSNYRFSGWTGDIPSKDKNDNPITITMNSNKSITANFMRIIYPPLNFNGRKVLNRSLSQAEYINVLTWQANPKNENIVNYRIYQVEGESKNLLVELNANTFQYWHRKVQKDKKYTYAITAVDDENREGEPAYIIVQSNKKGKDYNEKIFINNRVLNLFIRNSHYQRNIHYVKRRLF